jgi:hypothetical protein
LGKMFPVKFWFCKHSTPEARQALADAFIKEKNQGLTKALQNMPFCGSHIDARPGRLQHLLLPSHFHPHRTSNPFRHRPLAGLRRGVPRYTDTGL